MKFKEFIQGFTTVAKANIIELAKTELSNENKKMVLDHKIFEYVERAINGLTINLILKLTLKKLLLPNISLITQTIYDLLKEKIEGVTK